jgi:hypothetical protein
MGLQPMGRSPPSTVCHEDGGSVARLNVADVDVYVERCRPIEGEDGA